MRSVDASIDLHQPWPQPRLPMQASTSTYSTKGTRTYLQVHVTVRLQNLPDMQGFEVQKSNVLRRGCRHRTGSEILNLTLAGRVYLPKQSLSQLRAEDETLEPNPAGPAGRTRGLSRLRMRSRWSKQEFYDSILYSSFCSAAMSLA